MPGVISNSTINDLGPVVSIDTRPDLQEYQKYLFWSVEHYINRDLGR